jgi:hypothetical protein
MDQSATHNVPVAASALAGRDYSYFHALSWSAIIAGAIVIAAIGLILLTLGVGLGLSSMSPWAYHGVSGRAIAEGAIAWLVLSQILGCGLGGYLAGRLRHRWASVHKDEIHFRDTAQGFLAWSLAAVVTAGLLSSAGGAMLGLAPNDAGLYRAEMPVLVAPNSAPTAGASTGSTPMISDGSIDPSDPAALAAAHKATEYSALWVFIALLAGAFSAALFAVVGGRHRDTLFVYAS